MAMNRENRYPWVENIFRPLVIGVMFACIALSLVELVRLFFPDWNGTFLVLLCVLAALEAN
jgi:xanthine/uracil permease